MPSPARFDFAVDGDAHVAFVGIDPPIRVRRAGDARTAPLTTPASDVTVLAMLGRILEGL